MGEQSILLIILFLIEFAYLRILFIHLLYEDQIRRLLVEMYRFVRSDLQVIGSHFDHLLRKEFHPLTFELRLLIMDVHLGLHLHDQLSWWSEMGMDRGFEPASDATSLSYLGASQKKGSIRLAGHLYINLYCQVVFGSWQSIQIAGNLMQLSGLPHLICFLSW